ncbi:MAG: HAMP domain-containing histidine kinase [Lachnospiraceae bacterium]|nr:HAMP domain-containing histidine kinase [Lachnospiraceae bacterium]
MFNRSRKKIILSIMGSLILLFVVTLSVILLASYREIRQRDARMLEHYVETYRPRQVPEGQTDPGSLPDGQDGQAIPPDGQNSPFDPQDGQGHGPGRKQDEPPIDERMDYRLSTFYSVAFQEDGSVLSVDTGDRGLYEEEELIRIAKELAEGDRQSGRTGSLSYIVSPRSGYTLVAFMDNTVTENSLNMLVRNILIVGGAALIVLFFLALFLSKRIIRPLEENDRQQKQFISDASHELKTPVAVIGANAELLSRELGENEWLGNIQYENERMGGLVKQLLDLSRAENTETPMETVDLSRIVTGEALAFESLAFEQGKTIASDVAEEIHVMGNEPQLAQLVSVLLDNAVRHSLGNEILLSLKQEGHMAELFVENEGEEIPEEKRAHLFDRFYRIDEAREGEEQHYGLGLSIAKAVALKHGGNIRADSKDGRIRFTVMLPVRKQNV